MFLVGAIFVPFPPKTGTNLLHPRLPPQSLNGSCLCVFPFPIQANPCNNQPITLPHVRPAILSRVESFPYASRKGCWARLVITHREAWLREARCYKRCSRSLLPTTPQLVIGYLFFDLDICRRLHGRGDHGFASAPARSWNRSARCFVRRFILL